MERLGIKFAPLNIALKRRLETLSVTIWCIKALFAHLFCYAGSVYLLFFNTTARYFVLLYFLWMYYDRNTGNTGGRSEKWTSILAHSRWYQYIADYFPVKLVKTTDLDPNRNYLICCFPHGIFPTGTACAFGCENRGVKKMFPGLQLRFAVHSSLLYAPLYREISFLLGCINCSEKSLDFMLGTKPEPPYTGRITVLYVGGAAEALECIPGTYRVYIKERKGFVRVAMKHGAPLIPVFSFGESDLYDQVKGPNLHRIQQFIREKVGVAPVVVKGRGIFQYSFGVLPHRLPITVVVGSPIEVPKISHPTKEQINEYHKKFVDELTDLFETHKHKYLKDADSKHLVLV